MNPNSYGYPYGYGYYVPNGSSATNYSYNTYPSSYAFAYATPTYPPLPPSMPQYPAPPAIYQPVYAGIQPPADHGKASPSVPTSISVDEVVRYCEPCDKEFTTKASYDAHIASHEKCRHPGCEFHGTKVSTALHCVECLIAICRKLLLLTSMALTDCIAEVAIKRLI